MISVSGIFNTIIWLGTLQGFILSGLLFFSKRNRQSNRLLAKLIFLMALACLNICIFQTGLIHTSGIVATLHVLIPMVIVMPMGPLIYFYIRSLLEPGFKMTTKQRLHFWPIIIDLVPCISALIFFAGVLLGVIYPDAEPWGIFIDHYNVYSDIPRWLSVTAYVGLSAKFLVELKRKTNNQLNGQAVNFKWLQQFVRIFLVFQCIWLVYLVPYVIPRYTNYILDTFRWYPVFVPLSVMIYWLGIKGYILSFQQETATRKATPLHSTLSPATIKESVLLLQKAMQEDRLYLNPQLNLATLAKHTGIAQKIISAILNQNLQKSFNEFINEYRVEAFKKKLREEELNNLTMAGIATECGFNSQATFQRTFKEFTGLSPSEFKKSLSETRQ
jgi:AraC-like DNA-binding protein